MALAVGSGPATGTGSALQTVNSCISVFDKSGNRLAGFPKSLQTFFGNNVFIFDPRALYDWINHRYILIASTPNSYEIAVSTADSANGTYCIYNIGTVSSPGNLPDFPRLGQDRQAIYIASNVFNPAGTVFFWEEVFALPKAQLYACQGFSFPFHFQLSDGPLTDGTQPANVYSAGDQPRTEFLVTSKNINFGGGQCVSGCNGLVVWSWYDPFNTTGHGNSLTGVNVATANNYSLAPNATQPNSAATIDVGDTRISGSVVYSAGRLFASLTTNSSGLPTCLLYELHGVINNASPPAITSAVIDDERAMYGNTYYCTQQPDPEGNVTNVFNFSSGPLGFFGSTAFISRRVSPGVPFVDTGFFLQQGAGVYTQGRWGDYTATAIAGLVSGGGTGGFPTMWFAGMWAQSNGNWGTAVGRNGYTSIGQP
jgi:hypothetical protein